MLHIRTPFTYNFFIIFKANLKECKTKTNTRAILRSVRSSFPERRHSNRGQIRILSNGATSENESYSASRIGRV